MPENGHSVERAHVYSDLGQVGPRSVRILPGVLQHPRAVQLHRDSSPTQLRQCVGHRNRNSCHRHLHSSEHLERRRRDSGTDRAEWIWGEKLHTYVSRGRTPVLHSRGYCADRSKPRQRVYWARVSSFPDMGGRELSDCWQGLGRTVWELHELHRRGGVLVPPSNILVSGDVGAMRPCLPMMESSYF
jgi:hypothetical protein